MPSLAIIDCDVFTPSHRIAHGLVLVEGGMIQAVGRSQDIDLPPDTQLIDARGGWVTPGLVDLAWQAHAELPPESCGITTYARAISVHTEDDLPTLAEAAVELSRTPFLARTLGLHIILGEAPPAWDDLWAAADAAIALVTLSPSLDDAPDLLRRLLTERIPCIFDQQMVGQPGPVQLASEMLICGLAATNAYTNAPYQVASPAQRPDFGQKGPLLTSRPDRPLHGRDLFAMSKQGKGDFVTLLEAASATPARFLRLAQGRLVAGAPADLLCYTRFGELAWVMVAGETAREGETQGRGVAGTGGGRDEGMEGGGVVVEFLRGRKETVEVRKQESGESGVDLVWRYRQAHDREETTTIAVQVDASKDDSHFRFETHPDRPNSLLHTQADWYFYHFSATGRLYCLPVRGARAWLEQHHELQPPVDGIMAALPRARLVEMGR